MIVQSHYKNLQLEFRSDADDVLFLQQALFALDQGRHEFDLGSGGTSLRFFLARLSRTPGRYTVRAHPRLLSRPQDDLFHALSPFGTLVMKRDNELLHVISLGWQDTAEAYVKSVTSSQFVSAILLNGWNLDNPLTIKLSPQVASPSFLKMTISLCQQLGMDFDQGADQITILAKQKVKTQKLKSELDASSLFTLACYALLFGEIKIKPYKNTFGQPGFQFLKFFDEWNIKYQFTNHTMHIVKQELPKFVELNVKDCPDLFPVLCALVSFSEGMHRIYGAPKLVKKESNRIAKTEELLTLAGIPVTRLADGLVVHGMDSPAPKAFKFNPDHDHRMAFAAGLFAFAGFEVELADVDVVNKSFPQFWDILGLVNE